MVDSLLSVVSLPSCTICRFPNWNREFEEGTGKLCHEQSIEQYNDLQTSAHLGCPGCILLHEAWIWCVPDDRSRSDALVTFNIDASKMYFHLFKDQRVHDIEIFTLPGRPRLKHLACSSLLPSSTELRHNLSRIESWIKSCDESHRRCSAVTGFTPLRLLDLKQGSEDFIRLVSVVNVRYVCLSHCCGNTRSKHLTKRDNLLANEQRIPLLELPQTFQDAVDITKTLGIRYLWVDTFCIIQDDEKDWETQASLMAAIYENAYITIAAGASVDDDGGFFTEPLDKHTKPHKFHLNTNGIDYEIYIRYAVPHPDSGWPAGEVLPLMTRAWTLQERLLAKRYLCFGSQEIFWECQEDVSCSCTITEGPFNPSDGLPRFTRCQPLKYQCSRLDDLSLDDAASLWRQLARDYSERDLTKPSDKLPALAGLAKIFQRVFHSPYLAGLWLGSLREDLAWHALGDQTSLGRVRKGPSWTWAAAGDLRITWPELTLHSTFQVKGTSFDGNIEGFGRHIHGKSCHLLVSGVLLPVSIQTHLELEKFEQDFPLARHCQVVEWRRRHSEHTQLLVRRHGSLVKPAERESTEKCKEKDNTEKPVMYGTFFADYRFWDTETEVRETLQHVYFLLLGTESDTDPLWIDGMVLKPCLSPWNESEGWYERIGWLRYCVVESVKEAEWMPRGTLSTLKLF